MGVSPKRRESRSIMAQLSDSLGIDLLGGGQ